MIGVFIMKRIRFILLLFSIIILFVCCYFGFFTIPNKCVLVDGKNAPINSQLSNFTRVGDRLYYNYYGNIFNSGLYEISANGTKKINSAQVTFLPEYYISIPKIIAYNNELLTYSADIYSSDNKLSKINPETGEYELFNTFEFLLGSYSVTEEIQYPQSEFTIFDDVIYVLVNYVSEDDSVESKLFSFNGVKFECVLNFGTLVCNYCISKDYVYYTVVLNNQYYLYKSSLYSSESIFIKKLNYQNILRLIVDDEDIYIHSNTGKKNGHSTVFNEITENIYYEKISKNEKIEIFSGSCIYTQFNNGKLYYCDINKEKNGIYSYDSDFGYSQLLINEYASFLSIVDDKYIYFTDENSNLYRITQDGKNLEKVFG